MQKQSIFGVSFLTFSGKKKESVWNEENLEVVEGKEEIEKDRWYQHGQNCYKVKGLTQGRNNRNLHGKLDEQKTITCLGRHQQHRTRATEN